MALADFARGRVRWLEEEKKKWKEKKKTRRRRRKKKVSEQKQNKANNQMRECEKTNRRWWRVLLPLVSLALEVLGVLLGNLPHLCRGILDKS